MINASNKAYKFYIKLTIETSKIIKVSNDDF